jgi:hypothetical protein
MSKRGRGRPVVYKGNQKRHIAALIRQYGLTGAMVRLQADANATVEQFEGDEADCKAAAAEERRLAKERNLKLVPTPLTITLPTLGKIASEAGIELKRGRRAAA